MSTASFAALLGLLILLPSATAAAPPDEADDLARYVDGLSERGLNDLVVAEAEDFLRRFAGHPRADSVRYRMASALFAAGRAADAASHFRTLASRAGFRWRAEAGLRLGQCELTLDHPEAAAAALSAVLALETDSLAVPATFLLAEAEAARGRWREATAGYTEVLARAPEGEYALDAAVALVWCAHRLGAPDEVVTRAEDLLTRGLAAERAAEVRYLQGEALAALSRPKEAALAFAAVPPSDPLAPAALRGKAFAHAALGDHRAAAAAFEELLRLFPEGAHVGEALLQLGSQRLLAGDVEGAEEALDSQRAPRDATTLYWRSRVAAAQGQTDEALLLLDQAQALSPDETLRPHLHTARGNLLAGAGRAADAADAFLAAGSSDARAAAAVARLNGGDPAGALALVAPLLAERPQDGALLLVRAEALFALERFAEAEKVFEDVLQRGEPAARGRSHERLAWCRFLQGDHAGAAARFARLARERPESTEALFLEGRCHERLGHAEEARSAWERYLALHPRGLHAAEARLGLAHLTEGAAARAWLEDLLAQQPDAALAAQAHYELAESLAAEGRLDDAAARHRELLTRFPEHELAPAARYGLAWCRSEQGAVGEAADLLVPLAQPNGNLDPALHIAALELLTWCRARQGRPDLAEESWRALVAAGADGERRLGAARTVASAWVAAGQPERALALLDELAADSETACGALVEATWIAQQSGDLDGAEQRVRAALAQDASDVSAAEAAFFVAEARFAAGDVVAALPLYQAVSRVTASPRAAQALYKEGFVRLAGDEAAAAESCFERLLASHPQSELTGEVLFLAGEAAYRQGAWARAERWLAQVLREHPRHEVLPKARFRLGLALAQLARWEEAESCLSDLARAAPDFPNLAEAELWRGRALAHLGQDRAARAALERVIASERGLLGAQARLDVGRLHLSSGATEEALSEFLKVALLYGHPDEVAESLLLAGQCLERLGQPAQAAARYQEILERHPDSPWAADAKTRLAAL